MPGTVQYKLGMTAATVRSGMPVSGAFTSCIPAETDHLRRNPSISQAALLPTPSPLACGVRSGY